MEDYFNFLQIKYIPPSEYNDINFDYNPNINLYDVYDKFTTIKPVSKEVFYNNIMKALFAMNMYEIKTELLKYGPQYYNNFKDTFKKYILNAFTRSSFIDIYENRLSFVDEFNTIRETFYMDVFGHIPSSQEVRMLLNQKGDDLNEKAINYLKEMDKNSIIVDINFLITFIVDPIWDAIEDKFHVTNDMKVIIKNRLFRGLSVLINEKTNPRKIGIFNSRFIYKFNDSLIEINIALGTVSALTSLERIMQSSMKNFNNNFSISTEGEDPVNIDMLETVLFARKSLKNPINYVIFKNDDINYVNNKIGEVIETKISDITHFDVKFLNMSSWLSNPILHNDANTYGSNKKFIRAKLNMNEIWRRKITQNDIIKVIQKTLKLNLINVSYIYGFLDICFTDKEIEDTIEYELGIISFWHTISTLSIKGIKNITEANLVKTSYVSFFGKVYYSNGEYILNFDKQKTLKYGIDENKIIVWLLNKLKKIHNTNYELRNEGDKIYIKGFPYEKDLTENHKLFERVIKEPLYLNMFQAISNVKYNSMSSTQTISFSIKYAKILEKYIDLAKNRNWDIKVDDMNVIISGLKDDEMTLFKKLYDNKDKYISFNIFSNSIKIYNGAGTNTFEEILDMGDIYKNYRSTYIIDQEGERNSMKWFLIAKPIGDFRSLFYIDGIDENATSCNDMHKIYDYYGIEAAYAFLDEKLTKQLGDVYHGYVSLMASIMTNGGIIYSMNSAGMKNRRKVEQDNSDAFSENIANKIVSISQVGGSIGLATNNPILNKLKGSEEAFTRKIE